MFSPTSTPVLSSLCRKLLISPFTKRHEAYSKEMRGIALRLGNTLTKRPDRHDAIAFLRELPWLLPVLGLCLVISNTMHWSPTFDAATLRLAIIAIALPSLGEELLFRAALLPEPQPDTPLPKTRAALALALFVVWHPLQALFTSDERATVFVDPWFLLAVVALGLACTRLYWRSGSIWPAVVLHWLIVVGWKALAGGPALI